MKYMLFPFCHREKESLMKTPSIRLSIYNLNIKTKKKSLLHILVYSQLKKKSSVIE